MDTNKNTINPNGLAILNTLKNANGATLAFAEIAHLAGIEAKTGYLTAAKKLAKAEKLAIVKVEDGVTVTVKTETVYPTGHVAVAEKAITIDGYKLVDAE